MELNADLVAIQGILISAMKTTGEFTRINNRGGNEQKILNVMTEIQKYLSNKNYLIKNKINEKYDKELKDIVFFLCINTTYREPLELEEHDHLINIMPQLSKCLLVNIVYGLDLCKYYCKVIEELPISYSIELLEETIPCLKKSVPDVQLSYAFIFLKAAINKLVSVSDPKKEEDNIDKITTVANIILQNLTGLQYNMDEAKNWKAAQIYQHMGYCLLHLFKLLLYCEKDNQNLKRLIENLLGASCSVVKNITINVFCSWAEIEEDDVPLQNIISETAYLIVEKYQKCAEAKELLAMLATMAKKPKTLTERIQEADISVIIKQINKADADQRKWFQALLNTRLFENPDAVKCVNKWAHLCDVDDVTRLLNLSFQSNNQEANRLAIKCAAVLSLENLLLVTVRYYYKNKFKYVLNEDVHPQLTLIFNKAVEGSQIDEDFVKEISLLLLQNPSAVLSYMYSECVKNSFYTKCLRDTFSNIKAIAKIDNIGINIFNDVMSKIKPNMENVEKYIELFKVLLETDYFSSENILGILHCALQKSYEEKCPEDVHNLLEIFVGVSIKMPIKDGVKKLVELFLSIMNDYRCIVIEFDLTKQQIVKYIVEIIMDLCDINANYNFKVESNSEYDEFTTYYSKYLSSEMDLSLLTYFSPDFNIDRYGRCVAELLRILPRSVAYEWINVSQEICKECGLEKAMEILADVMLLLSQTIETQKENQQVTAALKYCIQNYGIVIKKIQEDSTLDTEVTVTKQLCRVLRYLPSDLKEEQGLPLANILTDRSLQSLVNDKEFICFLTTINNQLLCQTLAQRIMS